MSAYKVVSESSRTVIVLTASVEEDDKGGQGHAFYTSALLTSYFISSVIDDKIEKRVCIKFCLKLGKSATENLEMLHAAFGKHSAVLLMEFAFQVR
jgi:hypothetical protein